MTQLCLATVLLIFSIIASAHSMTLNNVPLLPVPLPFQPHIQPVQSPSTPLNLRPPLVSIAGESALNLNASTAQQQPHFLAPVESPRFKHPIQDKLHSAQQSLNDLFSDLVSKPLGLTHLTNGSLLSLEQLITDKLPRPLNALIATLAQSPNASHDDEQQNELATSEVPYSRASSSKPLGKSVKKKKNAALVNLMGRCYEPYGCFRISEPFRSIYRPINLIPEPPSAVKVSFHLRTRANPSVAERLPYSESSKFLKSQYFNPAHKIKIIVHGYLESSEESWIKEMSAALLNREKLLNVIAVDWMLGASPPYTQAVANTRLVGAIIAHLIRLVQDTYPDVAASNIHLLGHSLGAHIAGYVGQLIANLGRITALDPAEPYFQYTDPLVRLDPNDANFVDVIHTDVASIITGGFGMEKECGHIDVYPNGGKTQPGCKEAPIKNVWDSISKERTVFDGIRRFIGCNHLRSYELFIEAINSECPFMAFPCRNYDDFASGHCTGQLMEQQYDRLCFHNQQQQPIINLTCPVRLGLDSELDYRRQLERLGDSDRRELGLAYFLQTADRAPFCHYHFDLRVVLRVTPHRYMRNFRSRQFTIADNSALLNGRLYVTVVGRRGRTVAEMAFKHSDTAADLAEGTDRTGESIQLKEHNVLLSESDLGTILRLELDWRPFTAIQRPLQARAFRRWLPQLATLETSIPSVLSELQRTLNVNASQLHAHTSHLLSWPSQLPDLIHHPKGPATTAEAVQPFSQPNVVEPTQKAKEALPLLEAVVITKLETGEKTVFCTDEPATKMIFQNKPHSRTGTLINGKSVTGNLEEQPPMSTESLILQLCLGEVL